MTHHVASMLETYPKDLGNIDRQKLTECIDACFGCAQTCTACAAACLAEDTVVELSQCIRLNQDCADVCTVTGRVISRQTGTNGDVNRAQLEACRTACRACAEECEKHADMHAHCRTCAEACRRCEQACAELLSSMN